jgi:oligopeptide/dipeptide ABC transporter ATP-binding protein
MSGFEFVDGAPLLEVRDLRVDMATDDGSRRPLVAGVDLDVGYGETIGVVGESGSGKSLTARAVAGLLPRGLEAHGSVMYRGRSLLDAPSRNVARLRGPELSLVLQDPFTMLNPVVQCGRQIMELRRTPDGQRVKGEAARAEAAARLAEVGITDPEVADRYPFELSGGMRQRVALAASLAREPQLLIADEPSTALDVTTQREILALLKSLQVSRQMGLMLITHDLRVAFAVCDRVYVFYGGQVLELGGAADVERIPRHPYTLGLLCSEPPATKRLARLREIPGNVPGAAKAPTRCQFAPRCPWVRDKCTDGRPPLLALGDGRASACVRLDEIREEMDAQYARREADVEEAAPEIVAGEAPVVRVTDIAKCFQRGSKAHHALRGVSMETFAGESVGLVGESGSGKTTLARCLVGLAHGDTGEVTVDGRDVSDYRALSTKDRRLLHRTVQMVFQDPYSSLNPARSLGAALEEAITAAGERPSKARVAELLEMVGLPAAYAARRPRALSGGERQRVAIARALAVRPKLLICDEPVSALDMSVQAQILTLFRRLQADLGIGFLFISHDLAVVRQVTERIYVLYKGEIVEEGSTARVLDHPQHPYTKALLDSIPRSDPSWVDERADRSPHATPR